MKCFYQFRCIFDSTLSSPPRFKEVYGPVIKEEKDFVKIENNAENSIYVNIDGIALFDSPFELLHEKELVPARNFFLMKKNIR